MKRVMFVLVLLIIVAGCAAPEMDELQKVKQSEPLENVQEVTPLEQNTESNTIVADEKANSETIVESKPQWTYGGLAIGGNYADSDFVELGDGTYRMYYAIEPEVPGNKLEVYSATSSDGITWTPENGVRRTFTVFPDVVKLPHGKWRMYFQNAGVIKSATSSDGLSWKDDSGTRIDTRNNEGLTFENVAGPTTIYDDGKYIMVYSGAISGKYKDAPNNRMGVLLWATSSDGLKFEVKGIALDSRNDKYYGWADTPDLIRWDDGSIRLFFWGYFGVYESKFTGNSFTEPEMVYEAKDDNPMHRFPSSPPGDPTLGKVGKKCYMYYGQHTKGIYYAVLE